MAPLVLGCRRLHPLRGGLKCGACVDCDAISPRMQAGIPTPSALPFIDLRIPADSYILPAS